MRANYTQFNSPQFRLLSENQVEELHLASLQIIEKTGVTVECSEGLDILAEAGADTSDPRRVKIPSHLVEQALRDTPKAITLYSREGAPAMVLNGTTTHFGAQAAMDIYLDPFTGRLRKCYPQDVADMVRVVDALPGLEWQYCNSNLSTVPGTIVDLLSFLQMVLNTSKPVACCAIDRSSLAVLLETCAVISGGEKRLRDRPFFLNTSEPVTPLVQGKVSLEKSLLCAERGIPNAVYSMPMAGATTPATFPAVLAICNAEFLSQLAIIQLKKPGAPVIYGGQPSIMDMKTTFYPFGAPEAHFLDAALTELCHYYRLPFFGTAGQTDADVIDAQASAEATYQILLAALSGADFVHGVGEMCAGRAASPEYAVLCDEIIGMVSVSMGGIEINDETLPLELIHRVGPRGNYISEKHTLKHFRKFWVPTVFDRSVVKDENTKRCADILKEKTIGILRSHQPVPLPDDILKELGSIEWHWLKQAGLDEIPKLVEV